MQRHARMTIVGLVLVSLLFIPAPMHAQPQPPPAFRDLGIDVDQDSPLCFDPAASGVVLFGAVEGTIAYHWRTNTRNLLNPRRFERCGSDGTLYSAEPNGGAWRFSLSDPAGRAIKHLPSTLDTNRTGRVYTHADDTLLVSEDAGLTWGSQSNPILRQMTSLLVSPSDPHTLYGLVETSANETMYRTIDYTVIGSVDNGATWEARQSGHVGPCLFTQVSLNLVNGTQRTGDYLLMEINCSNHPGSGSARAVSLSADGGRSFVSIGSRNGSAVLEIANTPQGLLRYTSEAGIARSTDAGATWVRLPNQPPLNDAYTFSLPLATAPLDSQHVFLRDSIGQVWYSPTSGDTWQKISGITSYLFATPHLPPALITRSEKRLLVFETDTPRCFAETNQCMSGAIRNYWERSGGLAVFGYPISPQHEELVEDRHLQVQWFERDRIEIQADGSITTGRLGARYLELQGRPWQPGEQGAVPKNCRWFEQTRHMVCGALLAYWNTNGGLQRFGLPLTELREELIEGKPYQVQYFERRRIEYHPENAGTPYEILLGLLGRLVYSISP